MTNLQSKIRRDPRSYKEDFANQYQQYQSFLTLFMQAPSSADDQGIVSLRDLIDFVAHVADCYPDLTRGFSGDLIALLNQHHAELEPELREKIVGSLVLLRKKECIDSATYVALSIKSKPGTMLIPNAAFSTHFFPSSSQPPVRSFESFCIRRFCPTCATQTPKPRTTNSIEPSKPSSITSSLPSQHHPRAYGPSNLHESYGRSLSGTMQRRWKS